MKNYLLIILLYLGTASLYSQDVAEDSLRLQLSQTGGLEKARIYNKLARMYVLNNPDSSLHLAAQAALISLQYNDELVRAEALGTMAEGYGYKSEFDSATILYMIAIPMAERLNDRKMMARYYNGLGMVFYQVDDFQKALGYMEKASALKLEDGDLFSYAIITCNIAGVLNRVGRNREAIVLLKDAEKKLIGSPYPGIQANVYNTMGSIFQVGFNNLDSAEYYYQKNISLIDQPGLEAFRLAAYRNVGEIYAMTGRLGEAEINFKKALELSLLLQRRVERISIYSSLSDLYARTGEFEKAYDYKRWEKQLHDSVYSEDRETIIRQLEAQYQGEKKDAQIKQQQLDLQKRKNFIILLLSAAIVLVLVLLLTVLFFYFRKKSRDELEKAKSRIFQNIVHEIRTPLTLISGPLMQIRRESEDAANKENFERIERNTARLIGLVDELLLAARLEKKEYKLVYQVGDVVTFSRSLTDSFLPEAAGMQVQLSFTSGVQEWPVKFAASAYEKVLNNLVSNAIKYNRPGGWVKVALAADGNNLVLKVEDNGPGISRRDRDKLFKRFYRGGTQAHKQGFGIGLSLVAELVHLAGGDVQLDTAEGKGTLVTVFFPCEPEQETGISAAHDPEGELVLVVEDDEDIFRFIQDTLSRSGLTILRARDGAEGFEKAMQLLPDCILTDVIMPVEDGLGMTRRIKQEELVQHIPVIMLSAKASAESRMQGMETGADAYLAKPFNPDELAALVNNTLQTQRHNRKRYAEAPQEPVKPYTDRMAGDDLYLKKLVEVIDKHILEPEFSVNELADAMHISRSQLHRKITALTGLSTTHFIRNLRLEKARDLLAANAGNVTEIAYQCGFNSQSYFSKTFTDHFGKSPSDFLK